MTDWPAILFELNRLGLKDTEIEKFCGFSNAYVLHLKDGSIKEPSYSRGEKLLRLAEKHGVKRP